LIIGINCIENHERDIMTIEELLAGALHNLKQGRKMNRDGARQGAAVSFEAAEEQLQEALDGVSDLRNFRLYQRGYNND
jgi:hypothetical protein